MKYIALPHFTRIEKKIVKTYGIVVFRKCIPVKFVKDVYLDGDSVRTLVERLNEFEVELVHLYDIIEDFYFEQM